MTHIHDDTHNENTHINNDRQIHIHNDTHNDKYTMAKTKILLHTLLHTQ